MRGVLLLMILISVASLCQAQDDDTTVFTQAIDTTEFSEIEPLSTLYSDSILHGSMAPNLEKYQQESPPLKKFDTAQWKKIAVNNFSEEWPDPDTVKEKPIKRPAKKSNVDIGLTAKIISYVVIAGIIVVLLVYLLKNMNWDSKQVDRSTKILDPEASIDDIEQLQIADLLKQAIAAGNYRIAIRLQYLDLLKKLNATGRIVWMKDKTNRDYLSELFAKSWNFEEVRRLTLAYEQVWYGEHTLNLEGFTVLQHNFDYIDRQITTL